MHILRHEKLFLLILSFASMLVAYKYFLIFTNSNGIKLQKDLYIYLTAANILKDEKGKELYDQQTQNSYQKRLYNFDLALPFRYPPVTAALFLPFTNVSPKTAYILFFGINTLLIGISLKILIPTKIANYQKAVIYLLMFTFTPIISLTHLGQIYGLTFFILVCAYEAYKKSNDLLLGGICATLFIKPQMVIVIPFLFVLVKNKQKFVTGLLAILTVLMALSMLISGKDFMLTYFSFLINTESDKLGSYTFKMFTFYNLFGSLKGITNVIAAIINVDIFVLLLFLLRSKKTYNKTTLFGVLVTFSVLLSPHNTSVDHILLGIFCLIDYFTASDKYTKYLNLLVSLVFFATPLLTVAAIIDIKVEILFIIGATLLKTIRKRNEAKINLFAS